MAPVLRPGYPACPICPHCNKAATSVCTRGNPFRGKRSVGVEEFVQYVKEELFLICEKCYLQTRSYKRGKASPWTPTGLWVYTQGHYNYMGEMDKNIFW